MSTDTASSVASAQRRLKDLQTFQLPRLAGCKGPLGLHRELAEEMRADIARVERGLELSRELAECEVEEARAKWLGQIDTLDRELHDLRVGYREALVDSKRNITANARSRRHELLLSRGDGGESSVGEPSVEAQKAKARTGTSEDDALQTKTNEVTDALRRTTTLMQTELERSVLSVQMLDQSTQTLLSTQNLYDTYSNLLGTSTALVKALERADWTDRLLIFSAFFLFLLVVGWVLKRRVVDRLVGGVGWWVGGSFRLLRMGVGGGKAVKEVGVGVVSGLASVGTAATTVSSISLLASQLAKTGKAAKHSLDSAVDSLSPSSIDIPNPPSAIPSAASAITTRDEL